MIRGNDGGGGSPGLGWFSWQPQAAGWAEASAARGHVRTAGQCLSVCVCVCMRVDPRCWQHTHIHREPHIHMQHACAEGCNCCTVAAQILLQMAIDTRATDTRYTGYTRYMRYPRVRNGECFACAGGFWNLVYATPCRRPRFPSPLSLSACTTMCKSR